MLIYALHAAFENRKIAFNRVRMHVIAHPFISFVIDAFMAFEVIGKRKISTGFVRHHGGFFGDVLNNDWNKGCCTNAINMERTDLLSFAVHKRKNRVLVSMAAALNRAFLRPINVSSASTAPP